MRRGVIVLVGTLFVFYCGVFVTGFYLRHNHFPSTVGDLFGWLY